jgi:hypothetical protein
MGVSLTCFMCARQRLRPAKENGAQLGAVGSLFPMF